MTALPVAAATEALRAVDVALYAYSTIAPRLDDKGALAALVAFDTLRAHRDTLRSGLLAAGANPPVPDPAYDIGATGSAAAARAVALRTEEALAAAFAVLVRDESGGRRTVAAAWLTESAVRAVGWRAAAGISPTTVAFPGLSPLG